MLALFKTQTLTERLAAKATTLREIESSKLAASAAHLESADRAAAEAEAARLAAVAVEKAQAILAEAGVSV